VRPAFGRIPEPALCLFDTVALTTVTGVHGPGAGRQPASRVRQPVRIGGGAEAAVMTGKRPVHRDGRSRKERFASCGPASVRVVLAAVRHRSLLHHRNLGPVFFHAVGPPGRVE